MQPQTFILDNPAKRQRVSSLIAKLPLEGQIWDVVVREYEPRRGNDANRRLWKLHTLAAEVTGHSVDELHELMKWRFLPRSVVKIGDIEQEVAGSSSRLTKAEFHDFMCRAEEFYISQLGVVLGDDY